MYDLKFIRAEDEDVEYLFLKIRKWIEIYDKTSDEDELHDKLMGIYRRLRSDLSFTYKLVYRSNIVGCYTLRRVDDHMIIEDFYIDKKYWCMGFGEDAVRRCISDCVLPIRTEVHNLDFMTLSFFVNNGFTIERAIGNERLILFCPNVREIEEVRYIPEHDYIRMIAEAHKAQNPEKKKAGRKKTAPTPFEKKFSVIGDVYSSGRKRNKPLVSGSVFGKYDQQLTGLERLFYSADFPYFKKKEIIKVIDSTDKNE